MRETTKQGKVYAINQMSTNDPGLFGLARSGIATRRRITLILIKANDPKDPNPGFDWKAEDANVEDESFTYSLYRYMYDEYKIPSNYVPQKGFVDPSGFDPWEKIYAVKKNPIETFNENLKLVTAKRNHRLKVDYNLVRKHDSRKTGIYYYLDFHEANEEFGKHLQLSRCDGKWGEELFRTGKEALGWTYDRKKVIQGIH